MSSDTANSEAGHGDQIGLTLPLRAEYASTLRVVVSSVAADAEFSVDEIDDLRLAVSEVFNVLVDAAAGPTARMSASFVTDRASASDSTVLVELRCDELDDPLELDPLARTIVASIVDRHEITDRAVTLAKQAVESAGRTA